MVNFHESSSDIQLEDGHILVAQCNDADGEPQESRLDLDYYIGNNDGAFYWGGEGKLLHYASEKWLLMFLRLLWLC
jgi:hypothetical protein